MSTMNTMEKLSILTDAAKYDVSCSSSGSNRKNKKGGVGNASLPGICHSWSADGRCISLLKILLTNDCEYDCAYCVNRRTGDNERAEFTPEELVRITINFYRRNYIEGLFLSSAVKISPDYTMERMLQVVKKLRIEENYNGYIHLKVIPGADHKLIEEAGRYVDRMSLNLELPTNKSLQLLAPQKSKNQIMKPMSFVKNKIIENKSYERLFQNATKFVPAGQTTQVMVGASDDSDMSIVNLAEAMYDKMSMKRVYYSAYVPIVQNNSLLPTTKETPLLREHRLYQADWLLRFYNFKANEILDEVNPNLDLRIDPKCSWAVRNLHYFPVEINKADINLLLRIPGIGPVTARRILQSRRFSNLGYDDLKKIGVVLKRAKYFILCNGKFYGQKDFRPEIIRESLMLEDPKTRKIDLKQITLYDLYPAIF